MYKGYFIATFLIMFIHACFMINDDCNYICDTDGCNTFRKSSVDLSSLSYCKNNDIPTNISFTLVKERNDISEFPAKLQINFKPPQSMCKYQVLLLANELIDEEQCMNYTFKKFNDAKIHTRSIICFASTDNRYQGIMSIYFPYIFTACYFINFRFGNGKTIASNVFLKTNYSYTEVSNPMLECSYNIISDNTMNRVLNFEVNISTPIVEAVMVEVGLFYNSEGLKTCSTSRKELKDVYQIFNILENHVENKHHNFSTTLTTNGRYEAHGVLRTKEIIQNVDYCFVIYYSDIRCREKTLWKPPVLDGCIWTQRCRNMTNYNQFEYEISIDSDIHTSLLLHIGTITLIAICGYIYFIYIIHTCKKRRKRYHANTSNKWDVNELTDNKKEIQYANTDIVLLYPKGCESFMALMAEFREMLRKVCGCVVHDWYDGTEWNHVAEIGGSEWFAEMLHKQNRIIWIDTSRMRSLITQKFKRNNSEQHSFVEIGDFRDVVFPTIFKLAKRNVEESAAHESRHFIVRLKGFDIFKTETDPFVALSSHTRYFIPQDLNSLCLNLTTLKSDEVILSINQEEEHIEQYLCKIESDLNK